jgi:hypothetical protein
VEKAAFFARFFFNDPDSKEFKGRPRKWSTGRETHFGGSVM